MKKKVPLRWDKIVAMITILVIILCALIIYADFHKSEPKAHPVNGETLNSTGSAGQKTVCIDAGHGGNDHGAEYKDQVEKNQTLSMALAVKDKLEKKNIKVIMTRTTDTYVEVSDRVAKSNEAKAAALVSIHRNDSKSDSIKTRGIETWIFSSKPEDSYALANEIQNRLKSISGVVDRGVKCGTIDNPNTNYAINSKSAGASCIIELGFIKNEKDNDLIEKKQDALAEAIADGIEEYINRTEK